jgi:hypothetical protein
MHKDSLSVNDKWGFTGSDQESVGLWENRPSMQNLMGLSDLESKHAENDAWLELGVVKDMVNSPAHYTSGRVEVIEIIEDAVEEAPSAQAAVMQANALKYLLRLWHKENELQDAKKAQWYLNRLISLLE